MFAVSCTIYICGASCASTKLLWHAYHIRNFCSFFRLYNFELQAPEDWVMFSSKYVQLQNHFKVSVGSGTLDRMRELSRFPNVSDVHGETFDM